MLAMLAGAEDYDASWPCGTMIADPADAADLFETALAHYRSANPSQLAG